MHSKDNPAKRDKTIPATVGPATDKSVRTDDAKPDASGLIGEGSYEGSKLYADKIQHYVETADIASDAAAAEPRTEREAEELLRAETEAASRSKAPGQ